MSKKDISFTWHYDQNDTFDPPASDQPVTVYADPDLASASSASARAFSKTIGTGLLLTKSAENYTLVLRPPASDHPVETIWGRYLGDRKIDPASASIESGTASEDTRLTNDDCLFQSSIFIEGGTVFYDPSLSRNGSRFETWNTSITLEEGSSLKIGAAGGTDIVYSELGEKCSRFELNGDSSFELKVNEGHADHRGSFVLNDTSHMTTSGMVIYYMDATFALKNSAKLTGKSLAKAGSSVLVWNASISLQDQATFEIYSDKLDFVKKDAAGKFFTLNDASTMLRFFPLTETVELFEFGKSKYPTAMFNFAKDPGGLNQSRIFIPGSKLQAAFLRQAMVQDQVLAINGTIVQDTDLIDQKTETINGQYGTWISLSKKP